MATESPDPSIAEYFWKLFSDTIYDWSPYKYKFSLLKKIKNLISNFNESKRNIILNLYASIIYRLWYTDFWYINVDYAISNYFCICFHVANKCVVFHFYDFYEFALRDLKIYLLKSQIVHIKKRKLFIINFSIIFYIK